MKPGDWVRCIKKSIFAEHEATCPFGEIRQIEIIMGDSIKFYNTQEYNIALRFEVVSPKSTNYISLYHKLL